MINTFIRYFFIIGFAFLIGSGKIVTGKIALGNKLLKPSGGYFQDETKTKRKHKKHKKHTRKVNEEVIELSEAMKTYLNKNFLSSTRISITSSELPVCIMQDLANKKSSKLEVEKIVDKTLIQGFVIKSDCLFLFYKSNINDIDCKPAFCDGCIDAPCKEN